MANFGKFIMTNVGRTLQAKVQAGAPLHFTRMAVGDGNLGSNLIPNLTGLISPKKSLAIERLRAQAAGKTLVGSVLSNQDVTTGFYFREWGLFAQDPDAGEILYCYANSGAGAEYIAPGGGAEVIEKNINILVQTANAANVTAEIVSGVYALASDVGDMATVPTEAKDAAGAISELYEMIEEFNPVPPDGSITDAMIGNRTISDAAAPTGNTAAPTTLWSWLAYMIRSITGKSSWRTAPATTLEAAKTHMDAMTNVHGATSAATANRIIIRDAAGRAKVAAPAAADDIARLDSITTRLQNGITWRINNGMPEWSNDGGVTWNPMDNKNMFDDETGGFPQYKFPTVNFPSLSGGASDIDITASDTTVYMHCSASVNKDTLYMMNIATGAWTSQSIPGMAGGQAGASRARIVYVSGTNSLYVFSNQGGFALKRINLSNYTQTNLAIPSGSYQDPFGITTNGTDRIWVVCVSNGNLYEYNILNNTWSVLASAVPAGSAPLYLPYQNYLFCGSQFFDLESRTVFDGSIVVDISSTGLVAYSALDRSAYTFGSRYLYFNYSQTNLPGRRVAQVDGTTFQSIKAPLNFEMPSICVTTPTTGRVFGFNGGSVFYTNRELKKK